MRREATACKAALACEPRRALAIGALVLAWSAVPAFGGDYLTDPVTGCRVYNPHPNAGETFSWQGRCENGFAEGKGTLRWLQNGRETETDQGEWKGGHQTGKAIQVWSRGRFEGDVRDGLPDGKGVLTMGDIRYEGDFIAGKPDGTGTLKDTTGTFQGPWKAGCFKDGQRRAAVGVALKSCP
jgi:hypothetical protein